MNTYLRRITAPALALAVAILAIALWLPATNASATGASASSTTASSTTAAYPPSGACTVSIGQGTLTPGEQTTVTGSGFPASTRVTLSIGSTVLAHVTTDSNGSFQYAFVVPAGLVDGATITANSVNQTCSFSMGVAPIQTHRTTPPVAPNSHHSLANTGFATMSAAGIAFVLVLGGSLLMLVGRRRNSH